MRPRDPRPGWWRPFAVVVAASIAVLTSAGPASAHNVLVSSDPTADTVLARAPGTVVLVFDQDVQNLYAEMAVTIGSQAPVEFTPTVDGRDVSADLAAQHLRIPTGSGLTRWRIGYRIVSADGHPVTGLVNFSVGTATASSSLPAEASPTPPSDGARWGLVGGAAVLLVLAAAAVLLRVRRRGSVDY